MYELKGILIQKGETIQVTDKFQKQEFVVERTEMRGEYEAIDQVKFQLMQKNCGKVDPIALQSEVKVVFDVSGRPWEKDGKISYFVNLNAWKVDALIQVESIHELAADDTAKPPVKEDGTQDSLPF